MPAMIAARIRMPRNEGSTGGPLGRRDGRGARARPELPLAARSSFGLLAGGGPAGRRFFRLAIVVLLCRSGQGWV